MLLNDIKIAWRLMLKKPYLTLLKVVGLGLGVATCILLIEYISWQWGFDRFHTKRQQIVRIQNDHYVDAGLSSSSAMTYAGVPVVAKDLFPEVIDFVRFGKWIANDVVFRYNENMFRGKECFFTEPSFFDVFTFEMVQGDPETALLEPNCLVLTESTAKILFGHANPLHKEVIFENMRSFKVTGIAKDPPPQSHIQFDILGSLSTMTNWSLDVYGDDQLFAAYTYVYLKVQENTKLIDLERRLTEEIKRRKSDPNGYDEFKLQALEDIHLYSKLEHEIAMTGDGNNIWIPSFIAILILLLGWINHFNIFSAMVFDQSSSLGIRKILGANRKQIFTQLYIAASITIILGLVGGFALAKLSEPAISNTFQIPFDQISLLQMTWDGPAFYILLFLMIGSLFIGLIPAFALSFIKPLVLQKIDQSIVHHGLNYRKTLVSLQLITIIALIACTGIVYQQTVFMQRKDKGFSFEDVTVIKGPLGFNFEKLRSSFPIFSQQVKSHADVLEMSISKSIPGNQLELVDNVSSGDKTYSYSFYRNYGNLEYFDVYGIPFVAKDNSIEMGSTDQQYIVLNEMAAEFLGFHQAEEAIGKKISFWDREKEIKGVVKNYHQRSVHHSISPIIYDFGGDQLMTDGYYSIKSNELTNQRILLTSLEKSYTQFFPQTVFEPVDVVANYESQYLQDQRFMYLNMGFTILSLVLACMGLLGLMITTLEKRSKEISIRKILGASLNSILLLLTRDLLKLLSIAALIAGPLVYYLMSYWLQNFNYRIDFPWWVILVSSLLACIIAFLTISFQTIKAARTNPVKSLRQD